MFNIERLTPKRKMFYLQLARFLDFAMQTGRS